MTKKKFLVWLMLTICMSLTFNACDSDDGYYGDYTGNAPFLGTWYGMSTDITFTFNSSGYGIYTNQYGEYYNFSWDYGENYLDVYFNDGTIWNLDWRFTPKGYLALYDENLGYTTYYTR